MALTLFVKCDHCGKLEPIDAGYIHNDYEFNSSTENEENTWQCQECKDKEAQKLKSEGITRFGNLKELFG
jgi:uncharacterized protein YlaI